MGLEVLWGLWFCMGLSAECGKTGRGGHVGAAVFQSLWLTRDLAVLAINGEGGAYRLGPTSKILNGTAWFGS
jgi:hypothetical protein